MPTILIIEDNCDIRENLKECLELEGYHTCIAANGKNAIALLDETIPDLIICDIMMPEMDGHEVLRITRKKISTAAIPFIFSTSKSERKDLTDAYAMGADEFITKPYDPDMLIKKIEELIGSTGKK